MIRDNILYVADWFSGLHLYDISDPTQIKHISNYHTPGSSKGVILFNHYAIIGDDDQGLQIINVRDLLHPKWVSELTPESLSGNGLAYTMKLVNSTLYLADHRGGFHIIDLSNINQPKRLGGYNTPGKSWGIDVKEQFVFVADDSSGLLIFDATDLSNPKLISHFNPGGQAEDVVIKGSMAYVTFFDKGLYILDISQPRKPKMLGHTAIPGNARGLAVEDNLVYVAGWESGLHIVDTSNSATPHIIGSFNTNGSAWGVNIKNDVAYVMDWWGGIKVIDVSNPSKPTYISQYHARDSLQKIRSKNKYLYAVTGTSGLQIYDIKNPLNPIWVTGVDFTGFAQDVWLDDNRAYIAAGNGGVVLVDILDPFQSRLINTINTPGKALRVTIWNEYLYVQDSQAGLMVFDVRDTHHPKELNRYPLQIDDLWVDDYALWASSRQGLLWWKHQDNGVLSNKNLHELPKGSRWVRTQDDLVISASQNGHISILRKTNQGLISLGHYQTGETLLDLQVEENTVYALGKRRGLLAINISNPKRPRLTANYPATGRHTRIEISDRAAFFAGEPLLASVLLLPPITSKQLLVKKISSEEMEISLPDNIPTGSYHILLSSQGGHQRLAPNALTVQLSTSNTQDTPLKAMKRMLKTPLKSPLEQ